MTLPVPQSRFQENALIAKIQRDLGVSKTDAYFILAIECGQIPGDVMTPEQRERLDDTGQGDNVFA